MLVSCFKTIQGGGCISLSRDPISQPVATNFPQAKTYGVVPKEIYAQPQRHSRVKKYHEI